MATLPWSEFAVAEPERSYTAMVSYLPVESFRTVPRFLWYVLQILNQLRHATGLIGYTLQARIFSKRFFTLSVWESEEALRRFVEQEPHRGIVRDLAGAMGKTEFRFFSVKGTELPLTFEKELHRLTAQ
jgi:hypothetical protein